MALDTFVVLANQYASEADALADFEAIRKLYTALGLIDTNDAAVITRQSDGKIKVVKQVEAPTRQGGAAGLAVGLAIGALVALFPALGLAAAGAAAGGVGGAGVDAVAGHDVAGMSRADLKDLGEPQDANASGLLVVAAADVAARVDAAITRARKQVRGRLQADVVLKHEIDRIEV